MQQRWGIFAITAGAMLTFAMQFSMVAVALPHMARDLDAPIRWTGWVITAFMVAQVVSMPIAGRLCERFGVRNIFVFGFGCFATASLIAALAPNIAILILGRTVQGAAGGALMPSGMGLVGEAFDRDRARPIGLMGSVVPIGGIIGPSLGGVIVDGLGWRWTFALNVPIGALVVVLGLVFLRTGTRRPTGPIDLIGIAFLGLSLTALIYAFTELGRTTTDPSYLLVALASLTFVVSMVLFGIRQLRTASPVVDIELLRRRELISANLLAFAMGIAVFAISSLIPLYVQGGYGMTASESGALLTPRAMAMVGASGIAAMALTVTGYRKPLTAGMLLMASTLLLLSRGVEEPTLLGVGLSNFAWLTLIVALMGAAFGLTMPSMNNAAIDIAPDRLPAIAAFRGMFMSLGGTLGISVILLFVSRGDSPVAALEASFVGLAVILVAGTLLVFGIPEMGQEAVMEAPRGLPPVNRPVGEVTVARRSD